MANISIAIPWSYLPHDQAKGCATDLCVGQDCLDWCKGDYSLISLSYITQTWSSLNVLRVDFCDVDTLIMFAMALPDSVIPHR